MQLNARSAIFTLTSIIFLTMSIHAKAQVAPNPDLGIYLKPQTLAFLPDGRKIHFFCMGQGGPTAIIESGWGTPTMAWHRIQVEFAKITRVCVFDRPGYGFSDPGPLPRDSAAGVADLHAGLRSAHIPPPYILVGHSLGGFDARLFAYTYPREVAGLLLMDPPTEQIYRKTREPDEDLVAIERCIAIVKVKPLLPGAEDGCVDDPNKIMGPQWPAAVKALSVADQSKQSWFETLLSEDLAMVNQSTDELIAARHPLANLPLIILQADINCHTKGPAPATADERRDAARCTALEDQARDSKRGQRWIVEGSRHYIYHDKPDVAAKAFLEIVAMSRESGGEGRDAVGQAVQSSSRP